MRIKLTLTEKELDLLIGILNERINNMVYHSYLGLEYKNAISELKAKLAIYRACGEVMIDKLSTKEENYCQQDEEILYEVFKNEN